MAPAVELEFRSSVCIINCREVCQCEEKPLPIDSIDTTVINKTNEIIAKGQSVLTTALRSLRRNKSKPLNNTEEIILNDEKCRPIISLKEVADHDSYDDCWIILYDRVYDVTDFLNKHPGGSDVIIDYAGRDASIAFSGHSKYALLSLKLYEIGELPEKERIYRRPGLLRCDDLPE